MTVNNVSLLLRRLAQARGDTLCTDSHPNREREREREWQRRLHKLFMSDEIQGASSSGLDVPANDESMPAQECTLLAIPDRRV